MREPRIALLGSLAVVCAFVFVAARRMLRPGGMPREGMRRLLSGAAISAAILRTIDGAPVDGRGRPHELRASVKGPFPCPAGPRAASS